VRPGAGAIITPARKLTLGQNEQGPSVSVDCHDEDRYFQVPFSEMLSGAEVRLALEEPAAAATSIKQPDEPQTMPQAIDLHLIPKDRDRMGWLMTSRERVLAALGPPAQSTGHQSLIRRPVATVDLMDVAGAPFPAANRDPELMAPPGLDQLHGTRFDTIMPVFFRGPGVLCLGCAVDWGKKDTFPAVRHAAPLFKWSG